MQIHLQFSENIGTVIGDGVHPAFPALACPLLIHKELHHVNRIQTSRSQMKLRKPMEMACGVSA